MIKELTVNELFSGIGSQRKALELLGIPHRVVGISEIDKFAIKSYEAIFGATRNYGDISVVEKLDYADFWTYSFPCQDISVSGKLAGISKNTRSGLLYQVERLLNTAKEHNELPRYLMLENVKNLVGKKFKIQFDEWLLYLRELGYNNYWQVLNAKDYGIPQNRERVFVISIHKDVDNGTFKFAEGFDSGIRLKDVLESAVDEKYYLRQDLQDRFKQKIFDKQISNTVRCGGRGYLDHHQWDLVASNNLCIVGDTGGAFKQRENIYHPSGIAPTLLARDYKDPKRIIENSLHVVGTVRGCGLPFDKMHEQAGRVYSPDGIAPTVAAHSGGHLEPKILQIPRGYNKGGLHDNSPTVTTRSWECNNFVVASRGRYTDNGSIEQQFEINDSGTTNTITTVQKDNYVAEPQVLCPQLQYKSGDNQPNVYQDLRIRKLTPRECWRLMGFEDGDFDKGQSVNSNSQLYKQAGNSIVVNVLYHIFKKLFSEYIEE